MKIKYLKLIPFLISMPLLAQADTSEATQFVQYNNRAVMFIPFHQCYERIKNDAFYVGAEAFLVGSDKNHVLLNTELRMGYNFFFNQRDHLTPFAGAGYVEDFHVRHHPLQLHHRPGIAYGTAGFLYTHEFTSIFNLGLNAKILMGSPVSKKHFNWGSYVIGTQVGVPITFRFGRDRHWDLRLEPFNLYLHGSKASKDYSGCITTLGYRF
ncbi:MAG: hypothetical protein JSR39_02810 [Verrucomicrobia bacterium]|nr:hypothetical protein [Verrucomicrobiota bacterium]